MVNNCYIRCRVCGSVTRIRLQVGFLEQHPIVICCGKCGVSLSGNVRIGQKVSSLKFSFTNADVVDGSSPADYVVECSGEFPTSKPSPELKDRFYPPSPFIRNCALMGDRLDDFSNTIRLLNHARSKWTDFQRILDLFRKGNRQYLCQQIWKVLPKDRYPCRSELEILRAVHMIEAGVFLAALRPDMLGDPPFSAAVLKLEREQLSGLVAFLDKTDGYSLSELQAAIYKLYGEFIDVYPALIPAIAVQYYEKAAPDYSELGSSTSTFDTIKQFSLDAYETLGNLLAIPVALDNIKYRGDYTLCRTEEGRQVSLEGFLRLKKGQRYRLCNSHEAYERKLWIVLNTKLRNAIGHNDVDYDVFSQKITYVPNPLDRTKKATAYLLEFENETVRLFQSVTAAAEYLYRLREFALIHRVGKWKVF